MDVLSKVFREPLNQVHCGQVLHSLPNQSCTEAFIWNLYRNHVSSAKYYLPVLLWPFLFNWRKQSKKRVWATFKNYLQTTTFASTSNAIAFYILCIFRQLNGRFAKGWSLWVATYLAANIMWLAPPKVLQFYVTGITQATIEGVLRQLNVSLVHSRAAQTVIFMLCSLVVLRQQQAQKYPSFWFIRPALLAADYNNWQLGQRIKHGLLELRTYLGIGLGLDVLHVLQRRDFRKLQLKSTSFLLGYMGMFKAIQCLLMGRLSLQQTNLLAAFLSGSAFTVLQRIPLSFMTLAVVIACQVLWQQVCALEASNSKFLAILQRIPWAKLLIPFNLGYVVHGFFFRREIINSLARSFIDATCDNNAQRISNLMALPTETILNTVNKLPIKPFMF